jgi:hypothetical protein
MIRFLLAAEKNKIQFSNGRGKLTIPLKPNANKQTCFKEWNKSINEDKQKRIR